MSSVLNVNIFDALKIPTKQLIILYNEAIRQRALQSQVVAQGFNFKNEKFEKAMKIHGAYTEGFYEDELARFHAKKTL